MLGHAAMFTCSVVVLWCLLAHLHGQHNVNSCLPWLLQGLQHGDICHSCKLVSTTCYTLIESIAEGQVAPHAAAHLQPGSWPAAHSGRPAAAPPSSGPASEEFHPPSLSATPQCRVSLQGGGGPAACTWMLKPHLHIHLGTSRGHFAEGLH